MPRKREKYWYALRVFKDMSRAKKEFTEARYSTFVPYRVEQRLTGGTIPTNIPLIESLIFVKASENYVRDFCREHYPHALYYRDLPTGAPGIIPDEEMDLFMKVAAPLGAGIEFFDTSGPDYRVGQKVLITGGVFEGRTGYVFRKGGDRKVVVKFTDNFHFIIDILPEFVRKLDQGQ